MGWLKNEQSGAAVAAPGKRATGRTWSDQQNIIFDWFEAGDIASMYPVGHQGPYNLVVRARAGTGKTTTIIEGIDRAPETDICLFAFNKRIAEELNNRIANPNASAMTLHALGYRAIRDAWKYIKVDDRARGQYLTGKVLPFDEMRKSGELSIFNLVTRIHTQAREMFGRVPTNKEMLDLMIQFDLLPADTWVQWKPERVAECAVAAVQFAADETEAPRAVGIDYADMIFLPLVKGWLRKRYDLGVVDETQDMTEAQTRMVLAVVRGRICVVGDNKQAIYGFRGADSGGIDRLKKQLDAIELPLTTTYRCGRAIVAVAQRLVPDFEAGPNNPEGTVDDIDVSDLYDEVKPGDFILSRLNAPLVGLTLAFIRRGVRARMAGRDIGAGLALIIEKQLKCNAGTSVVDMLERLQLWAGSMRTKFAAYGRSDKIQMIDDQADTIAALAEEHDTVGAVLQSCGYLFEDGSDANTICCSTVHKAKGLERDTVFILKDTLYRRPGSENDPEERNIEYVAVTRAKSRLVWVTQERESV